MSAVARFLLGKGYRVTGSDVKESSVTRVLREEGAEVTIGHSARNVAGRDVAVFSSAVPADNLEKLEAQRLGIPLLHRSELLGLIMNDCCGYSIGVTGTNGKGTTSSLIAWVLHRAGMEPGFIIGAIPYNFGRNAVCGSGRYLVAEVDESDGSHLNVQPDCVICNNLELDHLNYYSGLEDIIATQRRFVETNDRLKLLALNMGDAGVRSLAADLKRPFVSYGVMGCAQDGAERCGEDGVQAWIKADGIDYAAAHAVLNADSARFRIYWKGHDEGEFTLSLPGEYNIENGLAAAAVCHELGVDFSVIREALGSFHGLENRFTVVRAGGVTLVKDYLSHPTGMRAVLAAARKLGSGRLWAVYKPYRFTLLKYLGGEYADAFQVADRVVLTDMFTAGEEPIPGIDDWYLDREVAARGVPVDHVSLTEQIPAFLRNNLKADDVVVLFGGDDFFRMADRFAEELCGGGSLIER